MSRDHQWSGKDAFFDCQLILAGGSFVESQTRRDCSNHCSRLNKKYGGHFTITIVSSGF